MEFLIAGSLIGAGYYLNNQTKNNKNIINKFKKYNTNMNTNINLDKLKSEEARIIHKQFQKSKNAINTNIIPPQFNNNIINNQNTSIKYLHKPEHTKNTENNYVSRLSGKVVNIEEFSHNNMTPFFGGSIKQNTYEYANQPILELHTGTDKYNINKKEIEPLFKPTKNINNVYGSQLSTQHELNQFVPTIKKQMELPFEQKQCGPGLNNGYTCEASGGFGQNNTRDYIIPKSTNEIRVLTNPKLSYKGRIISGKSTIINPGKLGKVVKNRQDTHSERGPSRYFTTVGAYTKEKKESNFVMPETNRKLTKSYAGSAAPATNKKSKASTKYRKASKNIYKTNGPRNADITTYSGNINHYDYGKNTIHLPLNERDNTGKRTHVTNVTSIVKALVAPIEDIFRKTKKENVIGNNRMSSNFSSNAPTKLTVYDPEDIARTTIKETNIHNNTTGNMNNRDGGYTYDPEDIARTTIKETNIHNNTTGNMNNRDGGYTYDPEDIARTTIKETNIHNNTTGNMNNLDRGYTYDPEDVARTTIKETNIHNNTTGNMNNLDRGYTYDPRYCSYNY